MKNGWKKLANTVFDTSELIALELIPNEYESEKVGTLNIYLRGGAKLIVRDKEAESFWVEWTASNLPNENSAS